MGSKRSGSAVGEGISQVPLPSGVVMPQARARLVHAPPIPARRGYFVPARCDYGYDEANGNDEVAEMDARPVPRALVVFAHEEPKSFNATLKNVAVETLGEMGFETKVSDLYAMHFDPVLGRKDIKGLDANVDYIQYFKATGEAYETGQLADDIMTEISKLKWADLIILQFPMYFFSVPAILKGWFDRVLVHKFSFDLDAGNIFEDGFMKGKKVLLSLTTGASQNFYTARGLNGDMNIILWPLMNGLHFYGFDVLKPHVFYNLDKADADERRLMLVDWEHHLRSIQDKKPVYFISKDNFDCNTPFTLKQEFLDSYEKHEYAPTVGQHLGKPLKKKQI